MNNPLKVIEFISKLIIAFFILVILSLIFVKKAEYVVGTGEVIPYKIERVYSPVEGKIEKINKLFGDKLKKGEPVIEISKKELEKKLMENSIILNEIELKQREVDLNLENIKKEEKANQLRVDILKLDIENLQEAYKAAKYRFEQGGLSKKELKSAEIEVKKKKLELERTENTFETKKQKIILEDTKKNLVERFNFYAIEDKKIRKDLESCTILSEKDNYVIITENLEETTGSLVQRGSFLYTIADISKLKMVVVLNEDKIGKVKVNQTAKIYLDAIPYEKFTTLNARVTKVYPQSNIENKQTYNKIELEINGFTEKLSKSKLENINLKSGLKGKAKIVVKKKKRLFMFLWDKVFE